ncbi:MAG: 5-formyltetrahydrofolate cyclo-ligase [Armatimonadetes bacterium]|nr:5-formyltetrahydrofolate cyclo-ligase [Armatimonadota bacterium]
MQARTKKEWREWARAKREGTDATLLLERLTSLLEWDAARHVLLYLALPNEIVVETLADIPGDKTFYVPRIAPRRVLTVHPYRPGETTLVQNAWGLREPAPNVPEVPPETLDLVVVPGLLFDEGGSRLGYGGGYYDRFLPRLRTACVTVSVAGENGIVPALPTEPHDIAVKLIVTPGRTFRLIGTTEPTPPPCSG